MKKINNYSGFSVIEGLLVLVIVALLGITGWYVFNSNKNAKNTLNEANKVNSSSPSTYTTAYKRTTTVPVSWKKYSSANYKFSFSYPSSWTLDSGAAKIYANSLQEVGASNAVGKSIGNDGISIFVFKQSLSQTLAMEQKAENTSNNGSNVTIHDRSLTYDGHAALMFKYPIKHADLNTVYLINANGYTYEIYLFSPHGDNTSPVSNNTLTAFESLKFN